MPLMRDFRAFILKEMYFPRGLLCLTTLPLSLKGQREDGELPGKGPCSPQRVASSLATAPSSQPASGPAGGPEVRRATSRNRHWDRGLACQGILREIFLKKGFMCIAPNHVLLLIGFGCSRSSSYLFHT